LRVVGREAGFPLEQLEAVPAAFSNITIWVRGFRSVSSMWLADSWVTRNRGNRILRSLASLDCSAVGGIVTRCVR
jgi:hypothetical protein